MAHKGLIAQAEAAGLYIESSDCGIAKTDVDLVCDKCNKVLMNLKKGDMIFTQTHGRCTCSWGCCEQAMPTNRPHERHLVHREH